MDPITNFKELESHFATLPVKKRIAVVCPSDDHTIEVVERCLRQNLAEFTLCLAEPSDWAERMASKHADKVAVELTSSADDAARAAVADVRSGHSDVVMKGAINTDNLLRAVLNKEEGLLKSGNVLTHMTAAEIPAYHKMLFFSDAAVIPQPDLTQLEAMIGYDVNILRNLRISNPKVALIHFTEKTNPKFVNTTYYQQIKQLNTHGYFGHGVTIDGPMDVKTACNRHSAEIKHIASSVSGNADLLIFPDLVSANTFYKSISLFAKATMAGIICGADAPVVIPSRADSAESKFFSLALACTALP